MMKRKNSFLIITVRNLFFHIDRKIFNKIAIEIKKRNCMKKECFNIYMALKNLNERSKKKEALRGQIYQPKSNLFVTTQIEKNNSGDNRKTIFITNVGIETFLEGLSRFDNFTRAS